MKDKLMRLAVMISSQLPEGRLKEVARRFYYKRFNPLYGLPKVIRGVKLEDKVLLVELNNGIRLYGHRDMSIRPEMKYSEPRKLGTIAPFKYFGTFLFFLSEQYVEAIYERYYQPQKGDVIVDVGANIGTFTVKAAKLVYDEGKVIAIEANSRNCDILRKNVEANGLKNVEIIHKGIWSVKSKMRLNINERIGGHSFYSSRGTGELEEVEVDTLDSILKESGIRRVDFIKMDIEGAEIEALKGMNETLRNDIKLAIAAYHMVNGKKAYKTIAPQLKEMGFEVHIRDGMVYC